MGRSVTTSGSAIVSRSSRWRSPISTIDRLAQQRELSRARARPRRRSSRARPCARAAARRRGRAGARRGSARRRAGGWRSPRSTRGRRTRSCSAPAPARSCRFRRGARRAARAAPLRSRRASCPARSRRRRCAAIRSRASGGPRAAGRSASSGPCEPASYCGSGPGCCAQARHLTIGSQIRHCASTSSLRVNSVASPRIASVISRS